MKYALVEEVAVPALVYRELYNVRHTHPDNLFEDFDVCPGELSLPAMMGSQALTDSTGCSCAPWTCRSLFRNGRIDLADLDPMRAEALVHVGYLEPLWSAWALRFTGERWFEVEEEMQRLRDQGLVTSRTDVESIAMSAYAEASGLPLEAVLDEHGG
jgi:hypothetical protein